MKLIRYEYPNPTSVYADFDRLLEATFRDFARYGLAASDGRTGPLADLYEDDQNYYLRFELPGVKKQEVKLELENAVLTLTGERQAEGNQGESFRFSRSVSVPDGIQVDQIKARFEDGLLTVTLPKAEARKPRLVNIA